MADQPTFPETVDSDSDDVSWALETGRTMWTQGDHQEGLKWLKRAADTASEEEDDMRSLALAKAAADKAEAQNATQTRHVGHGFRQVAQERRGRGHGAENAAVGNRPSPTCRLGSQNCRSPGIGLPAIV